MSELFGIAKDVITALFDRFLNRGEPYFAQVKTAGTAGVANYVFANCKTVYPAVTVINLGANTVNIGYAGSMTVPIATGASYTFRWKNIKNVTFDDLGNAATLAVVS